MGDGLSNETIWIRLEDDFYAIPGTDTWLDGALILR